MGYNIGVVGRIVINLLYNRKGGNESKLKAVASITFDGEFVVHDIKVIEGQNGMFIAMPSKKMGEGDFRDIAHPLTQEVRTQLKDAVLDAYAKAFPEEAE